MAPRPQGRRRDAELIAAAIEDGPLIAEQVGQDSLTPADVVALAEPRAPDAPLFALALADRPQLRDFFGRLEAIELEIDGADLARLGLGESPRVGEILAEVRRRKLNGELAGRESELSSRAGAGRAVVSVPLIRWEAPGPYVVVFTTRAGRRQRGAVRVAEPRPPDGRRRGARRREPPPAVRRGRAGRRT